MRRVKQSLTDNLSHNLARTDTYSRALARSLAAAALGLPVLLSAGAAEAEERLIVQGSDLLVVADRSVPCGETVPITVRSSDSGLFARDSERMQRTVDGVRAILGFECARMPGLTITGELGPDNRQVFRGRAGDATGWLVEVKSAEKTGTDGAGTAATGTGVPGTDGPGADVPATESPVIAGVKVGMTAEEAVESARENFSGSVAYRGAERVLVAEEGSCDLHGDSTPEAGSRCLEAVFTATATPRLHALGYAQAVDQDRREEIERQLTEWFGRPIDRVMSSGVPANGGHPYLFLSWGEREISDRRGDRLPFIGRPLRQLEAYAVARDGLTVVTIWSQSADAAAESDPKYQLRF